MGNQNYFCVKNFKANLKEENGTRKFQNKKMRHNVPTQKLLFKEKYFKEQLRNYMYLIVKQNAKSKKQKQKVKAND